MNNRILLTVWVCLLSGVMYAQKSEPKVNIGDIFVLGKVAQNDYQHIQFPKPNFIIKKGGIVNYKNLVGKKVEVTSFKKKKDGRLIARIQLTSKKYFFNSHKSLKVAIEAAIHQKELLKI